MAEIVGAIDMKLKHKQNVIIDVCTWKITGKKKETEITEICDTTLRASKDMPVTAQSCVVLVVL